MDFLILSAQEVSMLCSILHTLEALLRVTCLEDEVRGQTRLQHAVTLHWAAPFMGQHVALLACLPCWFGQGACSICLLT